MCYIFLNSLLFLIKKPTFDSLMHFHLLVNTVMSILAPYNSIFFLLSIFTLLIMHLNTEKSLNLTLELVLTCYRS